MLPITTKAPMTVGQFLSRFYPDKKKIIRKFRSFTNEPVLEGGNDMALSTALNINRSQIESYAEKKGK